MSHERHVDPPVLSALVDGELSPAEQLSVDDHLAICPDCRRVAAEIAGVVHIVARMPRMEAPGDLVTRVISSRRRLAFQRAVGEPGRWAAAAVAAVAMVITLAGPMLPPSGSDLVRMSNMIEMDWGEPAPEPLTTPERPVRKIVSEDAPSRLAGTYELAGAYEMRLEGRLAQQWVYSDGRHYLVVLRTKGAFLAPEGYEPAEDGKRLWSGPHDGLWAWEGGGHSWLMLAEEPRLDPERAIEPFPEGGPSVWARLGSAWTRLADALLGRR